MNDLTTVILPLWIWNDATNNDEFKANLTRYMNKNYPGYTVVSIKKGVARCRRVN